MDNELRLIRYLYGEEDHAEEIEQLLASDHTLRAAYRQLKVTKQQLDARPRHRPNRAVVDRIVAAAAMQRTESVPTVPEPRADREPAIRARSPRRRVLQVTSALAVLLVAIGVGIWQWEGRAPDAETPEVVDARAALEQRSAPLGSAAEEASLPDWDEADDDVVRLHHYIETLQARSSPNRWDSPGTALQPASQVLPSGR